jgi:acetyltransferase-like isoleucine patch superfamily enzyme
MRKINSDTLPHLMYCFKRSVCSKWYSVWSRLALSWWHVLLGKGCSFYGLPYFRRHPGSRITIAENCEFLSKHTSNLIGINRPCIISTLKEGAEIVIGRDCGFSGTVIGCAVRVVLGENVRCGANTLITDTDWHTDDPRSSPDAPVVIENGVWLGVNVIVLKGVTIGENTFVAAGSIVAKSLPSNVIAAGSPAKVIRSIG